MSRSSTAGRFGAALGLEQTSADVYPLLDWRLAVRLGGVLWLVGATTAFSAAIFTAPTRHIGASGWPVAVGIFVVAMAAGVYLLVRAEGVSPGHLLLMGYAGAVGLGASQSLTEPKVQYVVALALLTAYQLSVHPARRGLPLLAVVVVIEIGTTLLGGGGVSEVTESITSMICVALLAVMALINARVYRDAAAELAGRKAAAEQRALSDVLSGLGNRRAFDEALERELAASARYERPVGLIVLDVDHFKAINDRYGHEAGDAALIAIAAALTAEVRRPDTCFRWGGDEFTVLLPGAGIVEARQVADRIAAAVSRVRLRDGTSRASVTCGVAASNGDDTPAAMVRQADDDLLAGKRAQGRPQAAR